MNEKFEKELHKSMDMVNKILKEDVKVYFININNEAVLIDSKSSEIVNFVIKKEELGKIEYKNILKDKLKINVSRVEEVPFEYYNDFKRRYYIITLDKKDILDLDSNYIYTNIRNIEDNKSLDVIKELLK